MSLTPGKAHCPGSTQGSLAGTLTRLFQASTSPGSWQRPEVGAPGGGGGVGADSLRVMEKLEHQSWRACSIRVLMSTIGEEFVTFCQRCWNSQWPPWSTCLDRSWNLLAVIVLPLLPARPPTPLLQIRSSTSSLHSSHLPPGQKPTSHWYPVCPFSLPSVVLSRPSAGLHLPTLMAAGAQICSSSTQ